MTDRSSAAALVDELLHNYPHGRVIVGVDALDDAAARFADDLSAELASRDRAVRRHHVVSIEDFRGRVVTWFRSDEELPADAVLIADGVGLHAPGIVDVWKLSVWLTSERDPDPGDGEARRYLREVDPPRQADAIFDVSDPRHPVRRFSDWCVVPRR